MLELKKIKIISLVTLGFILLVKSFYINRNMSYFSMPMKESKTLNFGCDCHWDSIVDMMNHVLVNAGKDVKKHVNSLDFLISTMRYYIVSNGARKTLNLKDLEEKLEKLTKLRNQYRNSLVKKLKDGNFGEKEKMDENDNSNKTDDEHAKHMTFTEYSEIDETDTEFNENSENMKEENDNDNDVVEEGKDIKLNEELTIVLNCQKYSVKEMTTVYSMLKTINVMYPGVKVLVNSPYKTDPKHQPKGVTFFYSAKNANSDSWIWEDLIMRVMTQYVLILRDVAAVDRELRLHSLVYRLKKMDLYVIGGATKDANSGQWRIGCKQMALRNNVLVYKTGYRESEQSCVFCHQMDGPFIADADMLKNYPFTYKEIPDELVFHDLFLGLFKLFGKSNKFAVCPDSMFLTRTVPKVISRSQWLSFGVANEVHRIKFGTTGKSYTFTCDELGVEGNSAPDGQAVPYCTIKEMSDHIKFIMKTCRENNIPCKLSWGNQIAALKFNGVPPWEKDGDLTFHTPSAEKLLNLEPLFTARGYTLYYHKYTGEADSPWLRTESKWWRLDLFNKTHLDLVYMKSRGVPPTKVYFDGDWVEVSTNPALMARRMYGAEIFKHQDHTVVYGDKYRGQHYVPCEDREAFNCLHLLPTDGNLDLGDPVP